MIEKFSSIYVRKSQVKIVCTIVISLGLVELNQGYWATSIFILLSVGFVFILLVLPSKYALILMLVLIGEYAFIAIWQQRTGLVTQNYRNFELGLPNNTICTL